MFHLKQYPKTEEETMKEKLYGKTKYKLSKDYSALYDLVMAGSEIAAYIDDNGRRTLVSVRQTPVTIIIGYPGCNWFYGLAPIAKTDFIEVCTRLSLEFILPTTELYPLDFVAWYSGMEKEKIKKAYERYLKEKD